MKALLYVHASNNHWAYILRDPEHGKTMEDYGTLAFPNVPDHALIYSTIIYALTKLKHPKETEVRIFGITDLDFPNYQKISERNCPEMIKTVYNAH